MKNKYKIIIIFGITIVLLISFVYNRYNKQKEYSENIKNLYLNNNDNEIRNISSQDDE